MKYSKIKIVLIIPFIILLMILPMFLSPPVLSIQTEKYNDFEQKPPITEPNDENPLNFNELKTSDPGTWGSHYLTVKLYKVYIYNDHDKGDDKGDWKFFLKNPAGGTTETYHIELNEGYHDISGHEYTSLGWYVTGNTYFYAKGREDDKFLGEWWPDYDTGWYKRYIYIPSPTVGGWEYEKQNQRFSKTDSFRQADVTFYTYYYLKNYAPIVENIFFEANATNIAFSCSINDQDGDSIEAYDWNFGDGVTSTEASPFHKYADGGNYNISLRVKDYLGSWSEYYNLTIEVEGIAKIDNPINNEIFAYRQSIIFTGTGIDTDGFDIPEINFKWESNKDGYLGTGSNIIRSDLTAGKHIITLTVIDTDGDIGHDRIAIHIGPDFQISQEDIFFETGVGLTDVNVTVRNVGGDYFGEIAVRFIDEDENCLIKQIGADQIIVSLSRDESKTVSIKWEPVLFHVLIVIIDPDNEILELNEVNNIARKGAGGHTPVIQEVRSKYGFWENVNTIGTFIAGIDVYNMFTADIRDLDGVEDVINVIFELNGVKYSAIRDGGFFSSLWKYEFNMGALPPSKEEIPSNLLKIIAYDSMGKISKTRIIAINILTLPKWIMPIDLQNTVLKDFLNPFKNELRNLFQQELSDWILSNVITSSVESCFSEMIAQLRIHDLIDQINLVFTEQNTSISKLRNWINQYKSARANEVKYITELADDIIVKLEKYKEQLLNKIIPKIDEYLDKNEVNRDIWGSTLELFDFIKRKGESIFNWLISTAINIRDALIGLHTTLDLIINELFLENFESWVEFQELWFGEYVNTSKMMEWISNDLKLILESGLVDYLSNFIATLIFDPLYYLVEKEILEPIDRWISNAFILGFIRKMGVSINWDAKQQKYDMIIKIPSNVDPEKLENDKNPPGSMPGVGGKPNSIEFWIIVRLSYFVNGEVEIKAGGEGTVNVLGSVSSLKVVVDAYLNPDLSFNNATIEITLNIPIFSLSGSIDLWILKVKFGVAIGASISLKGIVKAVEEGIKLVFAAIDLGIWGRGWLQAKVDLGFAMAELYTSIYSNIHAVISYNFTSNELDAYLYGKPGIQLDWKFKWKLLWLRGSVSGRYRWDFEIRSPEEVNQTIEETEWTFNHNYTNYMDSRPRVATDGNGNAMMVWVENRIEDGKTFSDLYYSTWDGTDWGTPAFINFDEQADFDPALTYDSNGNAIVVWSRILGDPSTHTPEDPFGILETQEIVYSIWNGFTWSELQSITNDGYANGRAVITSSSNGKAMVVWVGDVDHNFTTTHDMDLYYSTWDGMTWTSKAMITNNNYMDYSASLAHDSMGNIILCWIRDRDGDSSTSLDRELLYADWDGNIWSLADNITDIEETKDSPSVTFDLNDNALVTWIGGNENFTKLYFASRDKTTGIWSDPEIVHKDTNFIYYPAINVDSDNTAVIVWRGFEDNEEERLYYFTHNATETYFDGEICYSIKDLSRVDSYWSEVKFLTSDNKTDWMASAVIIRGQSNDLLLAWDKDGIVSNLVHEIKPDLLISNSDIVFSDEHPMEGESVDITATIYNIGDVGAEDISVYFYNGDPAKGGILIGTSLINHLDYDANVDVRIPWAAEPGNNNIYIIIDYEELISELDETNNIAFNIIKILPDLIANDIWFSNNDPTEGEQIQIFANIQNLGGTSTNDIHVNFYSNNVLIGTQTIAYLEWRDETTIFIKWMATAGINNISIKIDQINEISEWNETNNVRSESIAILPDLKISSLSLSGYEIIPGDYITITAKIENIGNADVNNVIIEFFDGNPFIDGTLIESRISDISIGEILTFSFEWYPPTGIHQIFISVDRENFIIEENEANNILYNEFIVKLLPDLSISEEDLIYEVGSIKILTPVKNLGDIGASGIVVSVFDGDPAVGGILLDNQLINHIGPGENDTVILTIYSPPSTGYIFIVVDPENLILEQDETNNLIVIEYITIPIVDAGPDQQVFEGDLVQFTGTALVSGNIEDYIFSWDFGDGIFEEGTSPTHVYADDGLYIVKLTVTNHDFSGTDQLEVVVKNVAPTVDAGPDQTVNEGDGVSFSGSFTDPGSADTYTYVWDFGDGNTASGTLTPIHIFADNGVFTITLTITDDDGGVGTDILTITVNNVAPSVDAGTDQTADEGDTIFFNGCFDDPGTVDTHTIEWDFGDGNSASGTLTPTHEYGDNDVYIVTLTITDNGGDIGIDILTITVNNLAPTVNAGPDQTVNEGDEVNFSGSFTDPGSADTYTFVWDFGDESPTITDTLTPIHTYDDNGDYIVTLTITDDDGGVGTDVLTVIVNNVAPTVNAGPDQIVNEGDEVSFSGSFTDPGTADTHTILWNFGDGSPTITGTLTPTHTYGDNGEYTISLKVTDDDGGSTVSYLTIIVNNVIPTIDAGPDQTVDEGDVVSFSGSFMDPGEDTWTYLWDFGDGNTASGTSTPTHIYPDPGIYTVMLTVTDDDGGYGTDILVITVLDKTPPITTLTLGTHYIDEFETIYVTSTTIFTLTAYDAYSEILYTRYLINGEEFDYISPFTLSGPDGNYIISFYSADTMDNVEDPPKTIEVFLVNLKENSWLTDSDFNPITYFDFIFRKNKPVGYTLVATNPGQFYYHIEVVNDWPIAVDTLTIEQILPPEFILKGAMPIHVYLDGDDITGLCTIDYNTNIVLVTNVPSGSVLYITIHIDFGEKGKDYESLSDLVLKGYIFNTIVTGSGGGISPPGEGLYETDSSSSNLIGHQKKTTGICGFVTDVNGNPKENVTVVLLIGENEIAITKTDENGFYYFTDLEVSTTYTVQILSNGTPIAIMTVIAVKDEFVEASFYWLDI